VFASFLLGVKQGQFTVAQADAIVGSLLKELLTALQKEKRVRVCVRACARAHA
jgi:hypothetical protein